MFYVDTSVVVAYYCPEPLSDKAGNYLTKHFRPAISPLTELELFSAVFRKVREGDLDKGSGNRITAKFLSHLDDFFYEIVPIESHHYRLARDWLGQFSTPLRSLDAIHMAVASMEGATLVTADKRLAKSAESLAVDAILLSET